MGATNSDYETMTIGRPPKPSNTSSDQPPSFAFCLCLEKCSNYLCPIDNNSKCSQHWIKGCCYCNLCNCFHPCLACSTIHSHCRVIQMRYICLRALMRKSRITLCLKKFIASRCTFILLTIDNEKNVWIHENENMKDQANLSYHFLSY